MRIVGGKDYYDHGLAFGVDESLVFVRTGRKIRDLEFLPGHYVLSACPEIEIPREVNLRWPSDWREKGYSWKWRGLVYKTEDVHVILCGRYYHGVRVWWYPEGQFLSRKDWRVNSETFWDQNSLGKFLSRKGVSLIPPSSNKKRKNKWFSGERDRLQAFSHRKLTSEQIAWLVENQITVATSFSHEKESFKTREGSRDRYVEDGIWNVNSDTLKEINFIKVMDPVRAFQEISMWVGGVLPSQGNPMVEITDPKIVLHKHGFDERTSFRHPTRIPVKKRKAK